MSKIEVTNNILERKIRNKFQTKEGKKFLKENKERTIKEAKTNTGWFSEEEDKAWAYLQEEI
ncbi:hypothetical protein LCGC14_0595790 [marine sediment metagenome]|uniref:Uncharacterized protein n=1 Tax=marine sediment metagenome TaxID=412755 RepID=A0A0F9RBZ3_9ZZZZ